MDCNGIGVNTTEIKIKDQTIGKDYALYCGDSCEALTGIPDNSIHYSIFSPPFASLYVYSNSDRDLGNCRSDGEFDEHFRFIIEQLYRVIMPGRLVSFHCMNLPTSKERDGYIGIKDFRGELIKAFQDAGFIYHSEVCIWKDPVCAMQRTKALGLLHKQLKKDSCMSRQGIPDYLVTMRKPGNNDEPVTHTDESFPVRVWQKYASPIWTDINPSDTLQYKSARENEDERHICLAEGTLVLSKRGYIPIESLSVGDDEVLTESGEWHKVIAKARTRENAETVRVVAQGVPYLILTPDHKVRAKRGYGVQPKENLCRTEEQWLQASDLNGCYVKSVEPPVMVSNISAQEWWIIGRWLADGHIDARDKQFFVSVGKDKYESFCEMANGHIGHDADKTKECSCHQIGLIGLSDAARNILFKCGRGAKNKVLPVECISLNWELSKALYDGYMSGDGHFMKDGKETASSASRALLLGMAIVAQKVTGRVAAVYPGRKERTTIINGREIHGGQEWNMVVSPHFCYSKIDETSTWKKVKNVQEHDNADVWSIEVEEDHSFMAEGCVVKNCPLQLTVIRRGIELWTNKNDIVLTPFMGIGSEAYMAVKMNRRAVGIELKDSYYRQAVANVKEATKQRQPDLFDFIQAKEEESK